MIVRYMGGIGNQMWHYAFGRGVSEARQEPLMFTRDFFKLGKADGLLRSFTYCMDAWNIPEFRVAREVHNPIIHEEKFGVFQPSVYDAPPGASFVGPWQSEKYFLNVESKIREEFALREPPCEESFRVAEEIAQAGKGSMFIHVRRGDYLYGPNPAFHGAPSLMYYQKAMDLVLEHYNGSRVFIFSDDPAWCREKFFWSNCRVVDHNPPSSEDGKTQGREHEDIWLMSLCHNAAIANSSFSWWGAWLGYTKKDRLVFAPQRWLGPNNPQEPGPDLIPERWIKLEN